MKNFAGTEIRTHDLPTHVFVTIVLAFFWSQHVWPFSSCQLLWWTWQLSTGILYYCLVLKLSSSQFRSNRTIAARSDGHLFIGTTNNCVVEGSIDRRINLLIWGHRKRLDALAVHPDDVAFVTAGHDKVRSISCQMDGGSSC